MKSGTKEEGLNLLCELYPDLSEEELEEASYNMNRYLEVIARIHSALVHDPARKEQLTNLVADLPPSNEAKVTEIHTKRAARGANAPVPLDELIQETAARKPDLLKELIMNPAFAFRVAVGMEKRELLVALTNDERTLKDKQLHMTFRKPFDRMKRTAMVSGEEAK